MLEQLMQQFIGSEDGQRARDALQRNFGLSGSAAHESLTATAEAAHAQLPPSSDPAATHAGLLGALAGLAMGSTGAAAPGVVGGALSGQAGEMISKRTGIDPRTAAMVATAAVPFLMRFLQQRNAGGVQAAPMPQSGPSQPMSVNKETNPAKGPYVPDKLPMNPGAKSTARPGTPQKPSAVPNPWKRLV